MWPTLVITAQPESDEPMARDLVKDALDSLKHSMDLHRSATEQRLDRMEQAGTQLLQQMGELRGLVSSASARLENVATRVHDHGNALHALQLRPVADDDDRDDPDPNAPIAKSDYVTWAEMTRIVVFAVGLASILYTAINFVLTMNQRGTTP